MIVPCMVILAVILLLVKLLPSDGTDRFGRSPGSLEADLTGHVVCIDPGHGGSQPGAEAEGVFESELNLGIALHVQELLEDAGADVIMTREADRDVPLETRVEKANASGAEIFVSIHQNTAPESDGVSGSETWIYSSQTADAVALGSHIQSCLTIQTGSEDRGLYESPELVVLYRTQMTACLVECGFMSDHAELTRLMSEEGQTDAAYGIAEGIAAYLSGASAPSYHIRSQS